MVRRHEALLFVAPLEEREVDNPEALKLLLVAQTEPLAHLQSQRAELGTGLVGIVAAEDEHEVAVVGPHLLLQGEERLL